MTIDEIIDKAGGPQAIADASQRSRKKISVWAVYRWPERGIPELHWPLMMTLVRGLTVDEIFKANAVVKGKSVRPLKSEVRVA